MKNKYIREFPRAIFIGLSIFLVIMVINILNGQELKFDENLKLTFIYTLLYSFSLHIANTALFLFLDEFFINDRFSKKRIIIGFVSSFFLSLFVIFLLRLFINVVIKNETLSNFFRDEKASNYILASIFTFIVLLVIHVIYFYKWYQENKLKEQKIIAGTASAKFESLKNQIDPHFLFNSLNVLSSLIEENPENAQRFTTSLSKIYRYVLEQKNKELVTVQEELAFAKTYMNLLKMRFEDSITFEMPENFENQEAKVVSLSLQLLLENTIKHNIVSEKKPLHITIFVKDNYLVVQNDLQKKEVLQDRRGVGLQNIISRYGILTNRKVLIQETATVFAVHLPILTKQVMVFETIKTKESDAYSRAKKRVAALKGFYGNLISYCVVIPTLAFVNLKFMPQFQWFWFSLVGWGIGLTIHGFSVFGYGANWEERKINEILERENSKKNWK
jgi:hypothetical protein